MNVLSYLVTSNARRRLLRALWVDDASGSVSELARRAGMSYAATHRELESMRSACLAVSAREGNRVTYRAGGDLQRAELLRALLSEELPRNETRDAMVRSWLRVLGAPLVTPPAKSTPAIDHVVAEALVLSHRDATVARVLPLVLFKHRTDLPRIVDAATHRNERQALGMFLELAADLSHDTTLLAAARELHDKRCRRLRPFFAGKHGPRALAAARLNTPTTARRWGFLMNMGLDSFASTFRRHVAA